MKIKGRSINLEAVFEAFSTLSFGLILFWFVQSGKYLDYVTPKTAPYLYFMVVVMLLWTVFGLTKIFSPKHRARWGTGFVLLVPAMLLILPKGAYSPNVSGLSGQYAGGGTASVSVQPQETATAQTTEPTTQPDSAAETTVSDEDVIHVETRPPHTSQSIPQQAEITELLGLDEAGESIVVPDEQYIAWLDEIFQNPERYEGFTLTIKGFIYKDSQFVPEGNFVAARMMMTCCAADLAPAGIMCRYDKTAELGEDEWFSVTGTIVLAEQAAGDYVRTEPQLDVTGVEEADAVEGFVYPAY